MRTGTARLPLHGGRCPRWLFDRMKELGSAIIEVIVYEYGPDEVLRRLSDPVWFQAFGCVLGFDWHSSGLTTTVLGALKEGLRDRQKDLGVFIAGGKGRTSRKTPEEIAFYAEKYSFEVSPETLIYSSRMAAKVDNTALQDGYQLYHHVFIFTAHGQWAVVQQGMNERSGWARRYHWLGETVKDFVCEPHAAICCDRRTRVLNMVAEESGKARAVIAELARDHPSRTLRELNRLRELDLPQSHHIPRAGYMDKILYQIYERQPEDFKAVLGVEGVGPKTIRALALVAEVTYGAKSSFRDPVKYSFAHGGKDGHPFPVDRKVYEKSIEILRRSLSEARIGRSDKLQALKKLNALAEFWEK
ncbi:DUF763 domain-containing protein [Calderihabitans maritimus]|uniref:Uncharacterized conserved protein n=1 Tax=Calderihabitans maritimus TaxID=1246530 RepID=A0A1Z5HV80_9FIRM|nr:DUF763 domain-containing protein [Calderihabitans maritimus]GAW93241.1 uncharacterized conserved protein [Calderihabitans maritimus]